MQMTIRDKVKFAVTFFKSLWTPTDTLTAGVMLSDDGCYHLMIDDGADVIEAGMMYA